MRRKSTRNASKASPEKSVEMATRKSRRHSKRRKRSSSRSSSEGSDDVSLKAVAQQVTEVAAEDIPKIHLPGEEGAEPVWKVTPSAAPSGEIQKLKICLTRPSPASPDKNEPVGKRRRNKSGSQLDEDITSPEEKLLRKSRYRGSPGVSVEEQEEQLEDSEEKKGKGKSKTKHKSKSEKTPKIQDVQDETQSEISENVQVTPQSPQATIGIRVDNENVSTIAHETNSTQGVKTDSVSENTNASEICGVVPEKRENDVVEISSKDDDANSLLTETTAEITELQTQSDSHDSQVESGFRGFETSTKSTTEEQPEWEEKRIVEEKVEPEEQVEPKKIEEVEPEEQIEPKETVEPKEKIELEDKTEPEEAEDGECKIPEQEAANSKTLEQEVVEFKIPEQEIVDKNIEELVKQNDNDKNCEKQKVDQEITSSSKSENLEKMDVEAEIQTQTEDEAMQISEERVEQACVIDCKHESDHQLVDDHVEVIPESLQKEEFHEAPLRRESKTDSTSSEETDNVGQKEEAEEQMQNQSSSCFNKDESSIQSAVAEESQRSDEDSRSADVIIIDSSSTPKKEDTTFNLTQSFSPDIREIVEANKELQGMVQEVTELFRTPPKEQRKRNWGNSSASLELITPSLYRIDINTIKQYCPDLQFVEENELKMDIREVRDRRKSSSDQKEKRLDRKVSVEHQPSDTERKRLETQSSVNLSEMEVNEPEVDNSNIIAMNRKISIVDDTASKLKPPPSPAKNPVSEVLFITNLVRPFTLKQLKELLERTGKIKENGFWTDRIKSKCYVYYETTEEAEATRNALHGVHWPIGNGKKLIIDYATVEDLELARNPAPAPPPPVIPEQKISEKENQVQQKKHKLEEPEKIVKERERHKSETHVREWDIGKEDLHRLRSRSREREGRNEKNERRRHRRSTSPVDDFMSRKQRKKEEDVPQKLMDDLFRKTKTTPSIYWLPLTPEEIATKQQQRLLRMAEHKRRMEESSRSRGDYGRGAPYRRRYD